MALNRNCLRITTLRTLLSICASSPCSPSFVVLMIILRRFVQVLDALDFTGRSKWIDLVVMFVITAVYRLMFFLTLKLKEAMAK